MTDEELIEIIADCYWQDEGSPFNVETVAENILRRLREKGFDIVAREGEA